MGKHDVNEMAPPINKDLEQHYKDVIALKDSQLEEAKGVIARAMGTIDQLQLKLREKDGFIEELEKSLVQQTIRATMAEGINGR